MIGGALLQGPAAAAPGFALWHYARALPEPYRRDLGRALRGAATTWTGPREALRGEQAAVAAALTADPFEPESDEVLGRETEITDELAQRGAELLVDEIGRMSPRSAPPTPRRSRRPRPRPRRR